MSVFDYGESDADEDDSEDKTHLMSIRDNHVSGCTSFNHTIPKELVDKFDLEKGDKLQVEETETGWEVTPLDL